MSTSKLQREFSFALSTHFGQFTIRENSRPYWCTGPNFERLELDFWIEELDVAVEIQGAQHYVYTPHFHASYEDFKAQQARDEAKKQKCKDYRVLLLEVSDRLTYNEALIVIHDRANAERILTSKQKTERKFERKFEVLLQVYREFLAKEDLSDEQYLGRVPDLKRRAKEFRKLHGLRTILTIDKERLAEFGRLERAIDDGELSIRQRRTLQYGFYPGEEIIYLYQPIYKDFYYEIKGFVVFAKKKTAVIEIVTTRGIKQCKVPREAVIPAEHSVFDKKISSRTGPSTGWSDDEEDIA